MNIGKLGSTHGTTLKLSYQSGADIVLIQEPWIFSEYSRKATKIHSSFSTFTPILNLTVGPRVMIYTRNSVGLSPFQPAIHSRDLLQVCIRRKNKRAVKVFNLYNAPIGSVEAVAGLTNLLSLTQSPEILAGDFNIRHSLWDLAARHEACSEPLLA